jgi:hypothetical protein
MKAAQNPNSLPQSLPQKETANLIHPEHLMLETVIDMCQHSLFWLHNSPCHDRFSLQRDDLQNDVQQKKRSPHFRKTKKNVNKKVHNM